MLTVRDTSLRELDLIKDGPIEGGRDEEYGMSNDAESEIRNARKSHSSVDGLKINTNIAIRNEIVLSAINKGYWGGGSQYRNTAEKSC